MDKQRKGAVVMLREAALRTGARDGCRWRRWQDRGLEQATGVERQQQCAEPPVSQEQTLGNKTRCSELDGDVGGFRNGFKPSV